MSDPLLDRQVRRRLAVLRHAEEITGYVALTCRYFGISRPLYCTWLRRYRAVTAVVQGASADFCHIASGLCAGVGSPGADPLHG